MTQTGIVIKLLENQQAEVLVERGSACGGNCASCGGCSYKNKLTTVAFNRVTAQVGDTVVLETRTAKILKAAALVYLLPLVTFLLGYILAAASGLGETGAMLVSLGGLLLGLLLVVLVHKRRGRGDIQFEIISIR